MPTRGLRGAYAVEPGQVLHILKMQMNICLRDLPTRKKSTLPSRVPTHAYADCKISGQQPTQLYKEFPRIHEVGHSKKNDAQVKSDGGCEGHPVGEICRNLNGRWDDVTISVLTSNHEN